jgi:hypothetical protein
MRPHLPIANRPSAEYSLYHPQEAGMIYPPFRTWSICKHHQWMILTPEFLRHLRDWNEVMDMLAYVEFSWIPDESFFCIGNIYIDIHTFHCHLTWVYSCKLYVFFSQPRSTALSTAPKLSKEPTDSLNSLAVNTPIC